MIYFACYFFVLLQCLSGVVVMRLSYCSTAIYILQRDDPDIILHAFPYCFSCDLDATGMQFEDHFDTNWIEISLLLTETFQCWWRNRRQAILRQSWRNPGGIPSVAPPAVNFLQWMESNFDGTASLSAPLLQLVCLLLPLQMLLYRLHTHSSIFGCFLLLLLLLYYS